MALVYSVSKGIVKQLLRWWKNQAAHRTRKRGGRSEMNRNNTWENLPFVVAYFPS